MSEERVKITIENHIALVRLVRADKMNALDHPMLDAINQATIDLQHEKSVRAIVLSGEGKSFCAGLDVSNFTGMDSEITKPGGLMTRTHGLSNKYQNVCQGWRELPMPVIAAIHGVAIGGGFQLAMGADIRCAHPQTKMSIMEMRWGLIPDMGMMPVIRSLASDDVLRELTYTARVFTGEEAKSMGFVTHTTETPFEHAMSLAREIAAQNPTAVRASKAMFNDLHDASVKEALLTESRLQEAVLAHPNQKEAVIAQMQKRSPKFVD